MMCRTNYRKFFCALIVGLVVSLFQDPLLVCASSVESTTVKVGYYENALFQEGASDGAVKTGYAYEYYMKLSEYTGWKYEYVYGSFGELYQMLVDGEIDLLAGLAYKDERADLIGYPEDPMGSESYNLIKLEDNQEITSDLSSISGHSIGVLESAVSTALESYLITHELNAKIKYYSDTEALINAFDTGKVDILATEGSGTIFRDNYSIISTFGTSDYYICVNKQKTELLTALNDAQMNMFSDEPYFRSSLSSKYLAESVSMQAFSSVEREWLDSHGSITVGYLNNYLPYSDTLSSGRVTGVVKEIIPDILNALNVDNMTITYVGFDNYDDMIDAVNDESVDVAFPAGGGLYYSEQNGIYQTNPLVSVSTDLVYKDIVVNPNYATFAVNTNNKMQYYYIKSNYPNAEILYYEDTDACLNAVLKGEVDCTTLNGLRASEILRNHDYSDLYMRQLVAKDDRGMGVKIGNEGLLHLLNRGIHILGDDYLANISYQYVDGLYTYTFIDWIDNHVITIIICFIIIILILVVAFVVRIRAVKRAHEGLKHSTYGQNLMIESIADVLREPVSEIYDISQVAATTVDDEKLIQDGITRISDSSFEILGFLDEIIDINLLDKKKLVLKQDNVNIVTLIRDVEKKMQPKAENKGVSIAVIVGDIINKDVLVDRKRLMQVLEIVLSNAIEYTPAGGSVTLSAVERKCINPSSAELMFTVKDNGIGMSGEFKKVAFEPFTKEAVDRDSIVKGPGLGLAVANGIVGLMNGTINLESVEGEGCEVTIKTLCKINYGV